MKSLSGSNVAVFPSFDIRTIAAVSGESTRRIFTMLPCGVTTAFPSSHPLPGQLFSSCESRFEVVQLEALRRSASVGTDIMNDRK